MESRASRPDLGATAASRGHTATDDDAVRLRLALEVADLASWSWEPTGTIVWSPGAERLHGLDPGSFDGTPERALELIHPEDRSRVIEAATRVIAERSHYELEHRIVLPDGSVRTIVDWARAVTDPSSGHVRLVGISSDVTEERQKERLLHQHGRWLRSFEQAGEVITVVSADNHVVFQSPAVERLLGYRVDELGDSGLSALIHPDDAPHALTGLAKALTAPSETARVICRLRHRDGRWVRVECVAANLLHDPDIEGLVLRTRAVADIHHDELTGLGDRTAFEEHLAIAVRDASHCRARVAVVVIDIDRFAVVNKTVGRAGGDAVLVEATHRIEAVLRRHDYLARIGGDEFAVLAEVDSQADTLRLARRVAAAFDRPIAAGGSDVYLTVTVGAAVDAGDGDALWDAQLALGRAKRAGGAGCEVADVGRTGRATATLTTATALHGALDRDELRLEYQPLIDLESGALVAVEALMRWIRPGQHSVVAPGEFIPVAEQTGLIVPMGTWALQQACRQVAAWRSQTGCPVAVSVNLSPRQLRERRLLAVVTGALDASGLDPDALIVEITEDVALEGDECLGVLDVIRRLGVRVSVDDFGSGYAGVAYLRRFPLDILKIDRSLVTRSAPDDMAIVDGILRMADGLGLTTVAEGIEAYEDLMRVRSMGCQLGQGFLLGRPTTANNVAALLSD